MRLACIDIGTNTTRLLVADVDGVALRPLLERRCFTGLGHVWRTGAIEPSAIDAVAAAVAEQAGEARASGAGEVCVVATGAVRQAANGQALLEVVNAAGGVDARLLSGGEEARFAFLGATRAPTLRPGATRAPALRDDNPVGVVDVGGGSSELVVGSRSTGAVWSVSLAVGSALLTELHLLADPPTADQLAMARARVQGSFAGVLAPSVATGLAAGGSAASLAQVVGELLDASTLSGALALLVAAPSREVAASLGLDPRRARLLPAGILVLEAAVATLGVPLRIGTGGLREGVLLQRLSELESCS